MTYDVAKAKLIAYDAEREARLAQLEAGHAALLEALKAITADYEALCGDGLTESNQPAVLRAARAVMHAEETR